MASLQVVVPPLARKHSEWLTRSSGYCPATWLLLGVKLDGNTVQQYPGLRWAVLFVAVSITQCTTISASVANAPLLRRADSGITKAMPSPEVPEILPRRDPERKRWW